MHTHLFTLLGMRRHSLHLPWVCNGGEKGKVFVMVSQAKLLASSPYVAFVILYSIYNVLAGYYLTSFPMRIEDKVIGAPQEIAAFSH